MVLLARKPKSVLRYMLERDLTFTDLISEFGLQRSEGVVLRYLTDCYRALRSGLPMSAVTEQIEDITDDLGELIRGVDSSLIDEWEELTAQR